VPLEITPRHASFAKTCPQRIQLDVLRPCEPLPVPPFLEKLFRDGRDHEDETMSALGDGVADAAVIEAEDPDAREWHTERALACRAPVVAGGRLPVDEEAHRVGEPDLLVLDGDGYLPIEVKGHKVLDGVRPGGSGTALVSEIEDPFFESAAVDADHVARWRVDDLLQLAHYRRLLESSGHASSRRNVAGICGSEGCIVWYDLDARCLEPSVHAAASPETLSAMELYDVEFAHRLAVHVGALEHLGGADTALVAEPIACHECDMCPWRVWCGERLEEVGDLSLLAGLGAERRRLYKDAGVDDLSAMAALDWRTAELLRRKVDLVDLLGKARGLPATTTLESLIPKRTKQLGDLASLGLVTVADLGAVDQRTLELAPAAGSGLATHIELARARTGTSAAYRRRDVEHVHVPRADVEVDVDMESTNDGCYLWGALVADRRIAPPTTRYVSFATWDRDIEDGELAAFADFWSWFADERARTEAAGSSFRAYCYSSAEQRQMTRLADRLGRRDEVDDLVASDCWVDLLEVVRAQLITGHGLGLKEIAPLAGFSWRSDDSGGTLAMVKYDEATDDGGGLGPREAARRWILDYNEDDVRATASLRDWLDGPARTLPPITSAAA
jgi:predicted RecB family nuclease